MPTWETLLVFTGAAFILNISPGPSNFYILSRSISQGASAGFAAAAGMALGSLVHVVAAAVGLSAVFQYSPLAYTMLKFAGGAYLIWLGLRMLFDRSRSFEEEAAPSHLPLPAVFRQSVLVEVMNPKTALFFIAFLPQFVDPQIATIPTQMLVLGSIVTLTALPCDAAVAIAADRSAVLLRNNPNATRIQNWLSGTILVGLGGYVLAAGRASD